MNLRSRTVGRNPLNLVFRFVLEVAVLVAVGFATWSLLDGPWRWLGVVGGPLVLMMVWGMFNVPGDPSRGGGAPVPVSGRVRLYIEIGFFAVGATAFALASTPWAGIAFALAVIAHYFLSLDRVGWLLTK